MAEIQLRAPLASDDGALLARCASDPAAWQALPKLGETHRSSVARLRLSAGPAVVKRYSEPAGFRLLTFARKSRAEREARALDLVAAAVPDGAVRVLAWGEQRRFGCVAWSLLATAELEDSFDLRRIKTLGARDRADAVRAVKERLPRLVARLHARRVYAATLRGKNVLLQPDTGRIALVDLPYAREVTWFSARHRLRDLAILSLELCRFLSAAEWEEFLTSYRAAARELGANDAEQVSAQRIAPVAARVGHRTAGASARKRIRRRFRRTRIGEWLTGHRYAAKGIGLDVPLDDRQLEMYAGSRRREERAESYATKYDRELHKRISSYFERRAIRRALAITGAQRATVLDVPCGAGRLTPLLQSVSGRLFSCDYSPAMLRQFRSAHRAPCFVGSAFDLPFADRSLDVVFSARLSHHISSDERRADYLREIMRTSSRWVIVTIFDRGSLKSRLRELSRRFTGKRSKHTFARSDLERIAAASGFRIVAGLPLSRLASGHVFYVLERTEAA